AGETRPASALRSHGCRAQVANARRRHEPARAAPDFPPRPDPGPMIVGPCRVIRGGPSPAVLEHAGVRVAGSHIAQVGPLAPLLAAHPEENLWDGGGRVMLPGLVDAHAHLARHLARGLGLEREADWECYDRALAPEDVL